MEDAIETLLGEEIVDELDEHEDMRELAGTGCIRRRVITGFFSQSMIQ